MVTIETSSSTCTIRTNKRCNPKTWNDTGGYRDGCCTGDQPCGEGEGDCSNDSDCMPGLECGSPHCPKDQGFSDRAECCGPISAEFQPGNILPVVFLLAIILYMLRLFLLIFIFFLVYGYKKMYKKECNQHKYGEFDQLEDAKEACDEDANCASIYDVSCGDENTFHLCPNGEDVLNESWFNDCVHDKVITSKA